MNKAKSIQADSSNLSYPTVSPAMMTAPFEAMISAHRRVFEQVDALNRLWQDSVQEATSRGADLSARLVKCNNPAEGASLCNEWVRERALRFASDSQTATKLWMGLYGSPFAGSNEVVGSHRKSEKRGA